MTGHLVVGIDGSDESGTALEWAVAEAQLRGLQLHILHALNVPMVADPYGSPIALPRIDELESYAGNLLTVAQQKATQLAPELVVSTRFEMGAPAAVLLRASEEADGVVVGSRGLGAIGGALIGSVSIRLAGKSASPVFIIPPEVGDLDTVSGPVVAGVDGSDFGDAALLLALKEAALRGTSVRAVCAYHLPWLAMPTDPELISEFDVAERAYAERMISESVERVRTHDCQSVDVDLEVIKSPPADALIESGRDAALTVVGSRGHGAIRRMLLGSISRAVLQEATRPVAIVHVPKAEEP